MKKEAIFANFSKLNREQRYQKLLSLGFLTSDEIALLERAVEQPYINLADQLIENVIGCMPLALGIAVNFVIDDTPRVIPMAVEETSIVAAASAAAKWICNRGTITTAIQGHNIIGQIQVAKVNDLSKLQRLLTLHKDTLIDDVNHNVVPSLVKRGGGVNDLVVRHIQRDNGKYMAIIHVHMNPCDAMGANLVSQVCEYLKNPIEDLTQEKVTMCILSNLTDTKLITAKVSIPNIDLAFADKIIEANLFAKLDPYRAATHNKGIMNGIDPVLIATGNDWRAVEAGMHAYAARDYQYRALTRWHLAESTLTGELTAPMAVGIVGGVTRLHPLAQLSLKLLRVQSADELARIAMAVGLVQNFAALRALTNEGIIKGHMKLHINNLVLSSGATAEEQPLLLEKLTAFFQQQRKVTTSDATRLLAEIRQQYVNT
jgi:hydroxymethylglutaryl-CoA reductase